MSKPRKVTHDATERLIGYLRVSSNAQGIQGLGIEAQRRAISEYVSRLGPKALLLGEYVEVESGRRADRPELLKAMDHCRNAGAVLTIAKLDRLSRDAHFLTGLQRAGVEFVACDLPNANRLTITILAAVAEHERELISERTKAALRIAKERVAITGQRGRPDVKRLGNPLGAAALAGRGNLEAVAAIAARSQASAYRLAGIVGTLKAEGVVSVRATAQALNDRGVLSPGGGIWHPTAVARLFRRLNGGSQGR